MRLDWTWVFLVFASFASASAFAHFEGHGPRIAGKGPGGGAMAAVISASEAEFGEKAEAVAVAEWFRRDQTIEIRLWDTARKQPVSLPDASEVKWILIGGSLGKAEVVLSIVGGSRFIKAFADDSLARAGSLEVILPPDGKGQKRVVVIPMGAVLK